MIRINLFILSLELEVQLSSVCLVVFVFSDRCVSGTCSDFHTQTCSDLSRLSAAVLCTLRN